MARSLKSFASREAAGRALAERLCATPPAQPVVYALPRGGVPVALEIARALNAPLDLLFVRKIGAPGNEELALGAVVDGAASYLFVNEDVRRAYRVSEAELEDAKRRELREIERRRALYMKNRAPIAASGRTAIVVDDGLATGATAKAALESLRHQGARRIILAVPVAPSETLAEMADYADEVVCLASPKTFFGVAQFYEDFHQLTDEETVRLLAAATSAANPNAPASDASARRSVVIPPHSSRGDLTVPAEPIGCVVFAHGSGSSRLSPRNVAVAEALNRRGVATLLLDLLTEQEARDRRNVFDIRLLAERLIEAVLWLSSEPDVEDLTIGLFGASTGAAAAITAGAALGNRVRAIVSRGGRPDLAPRALPKVTAPTLLIVGGLDTEVLALNHEAWAALTCEKALEVVDGAGHLFEEPGALERVMTLAGAWFERHLPTRARAAPAPPITGLADVADAAEPLPDFDDPAFGAAFDRFGDKPLVLLGEASHGTSEFYRARAAITRRLVERHGFSAVAVEADWPDAAAIDRYVRHNAREVPSTPFNRFPTWMWRNADMDAFTRWLRRHNESLAPERRVAFYGLDLYNMNASIAAVLAYLDRVDPKAAAAARLRYACLNPWSREPAAYGLASLEEGYALCEQPVTRILVDLLNSEMRYAREDGENFLDAMQNARLVADAERYYRAMYHGASESWNLRDMHMFETLENVRARRGPGSKVVVWAHNSHIGDARFTAMGAERGELNLGQLCRERFGGAVVLIGLGTHTGTVAAASDWEAPMEVKRVRPSRPDSHEALCHATGRSRFLLDLREGRNEEARRALAAERLERYIGVVYRPDTERWSHYSYASLSRQYDAFVWFDETSAVTPLAGAAPPGDDETYPFGL